MLHSELILAQLFHGVRVPMYLTGSAAVELVPGVYADQLQTPQGELCEMKSVSLRDHLSTDATQHVFRTC